MRKALIIGLNNYPFNKSLSSDEDAKKMYQVLSKNTDNSENFYCKTLISSEKETISKSTIKSNILNLLDNDNYVSILYFSGLSYYDGSDNEFYLVAENSTNDDKGISFNEIILLVNNSKTRNIIIILDCCHSGAAGNFSLETKNISSIREGVSILGASRLNEKALENVSGGVFTSLLYDALNGNVADSEGNINVLNLYNYVYKLLTPWQQIPIFKTNTYDLINLRKCFPKPKITNDIPKLIEALNEIQESDQMKFLNQFINKMKTKDKNKVFISYSRKDVEWLTEIKVHLKPIIRKGIIKIWDDTEIKIGQEWKVEIDKALEASKIALLLISPNFLASDFIVDNELPLLLKSAEEGGTKIIPIILSYCGFTEDNNLSKFQSINDPEIPIDSLSKSEQNKIFKQLAYDLEKILNL